MTSWTALSDKIEKVGLVGCGRMGCCMLESMLNAGYEVVACDAFPAAAERAGKMGAQVAADPAGVAEKASVIIMSLPGPAQLDEVLASGDRSLLRDDLFRGL